MPKGLTEQLSATEGFSDGTSKDVTSQVTWTSSNPGMATVSSGGLLSAVGQGPVSVTASLAGLTGTTSVDVVAPVAFVMIDPPLLLLRAGTTHQMAAIAWLTNGTRLPVTNLTTWRVSFAAEGPRSTLRASCRSPRPVAALVSASVGRWTAYGLVLALR